MAENYKTKVLQMVVNDYLDEIVTSNYEKDIKLQDVEIDRIVWELATKIYTRSGYQIELIWVRDIVYSRIEAMKRQQAVEKQKKEELERIATEQARIAEKARLLAAEQKARREAEQKRQDEEVRRLKAEEEARLAAEKERIAQEALRIKQQRLEAEKEKNLIQFKEKYREKISSIMMLFDGDEDKAITFIFVSKVVIEQFSVHESEAMPDSNLLNYPNVDGLDFLELQMALEEEFDIEISEEERDELGFPEFTISYDFSFLSGRRSIPDPPRIDTFNEKVGECLVSDLVELILKKVAVKDFLYINT